MPLLNANAMAPPRAATIPRPIQNGALPRATNNEVAIAPAAAGGTRSAVNSPNRPLEMAEATFTPKLARLILPSAAPIEPARLDASAVPVMNEVAT